MNWVNHARSIRLFQNSIRSWSFLSGERIGNANFLLSLSHPPHAVRKSPTTPPLENPMRHLKQTLSRSPNLPGACLAWRRQPSSPADRVTHHLRVPRIGGSNQSTRIHLERFGGPELGDQTSFPGPKINSWDWRESNYADPTAQGIALAPAQPANPRHRPHQLFVLPNVA